jgi:hypothetical protein
MTEHDGNSSPSRNLERRPLLWIGLGMALILLLIIGMVSMHAAANSFHQPPSKKGQLALITNSGSTNAPGSTLTLNTDGSGSLVYQKDRGNSFRFADKTFAAGTFAVAQLENLLTHIGDVSAIPNHGCLKSISFGSTTTITYQGKTSGDVSCLSNADQKIHLAVKEQVETLYMQAQKNN